MSDLLLTARAPTTVGRLRALVAHLAELPDDVPVNLVLDVTVPTWAGPIYVQEASPGSEKIHASCETTGEVQFFD